MPANAHFCHEFSVRIVLGSLLQACVRQRVSMTVLASFYHAHYLRVFVRINKKDRLGASELLKKFGRVIYCKKCGFNSVFDCVGLQKL